MDWTIQDSARTHGMGSRDTSRRWRAYILRPHGRPQHCVPPDPEPSWPDVARGTSIVVSTRAPSTLAPTEILQCHTASGSAHQTGSVSTIEDYVRASIITDQSEDIHTDTNTPPASVCDLQDAKCILSKNSECAPTLQDKWLCEQFQTWTQIITARILSNTTFKQALLDSCGSSLCDPDDPVYASAMMSSRNMCAKQK